jgi:hypothetical protein
MKFGVVWRSMIFDKSEKSTKTQKKHSKKILVDFLGLYWDF